MSTTKIGHFVWYELKTSEPTEALAFYQHVVGWTTHAEESGAYTTIMSPQGALGGVVELSEHDRAKGRRPHWIANVTVVNVDAAAAKAQELGGTVIMEPKSMPDVGRFAVIADPQGVELALFAPSFDLNDQDGTKVGSFCWNELITPSQPGALEFYGKLFGWEKIGQHDMGPMGTYYLFGQDDRDFGGIMQKPADMPMPPAWVYYINVGSLEPAMARAEEKGARLLMGPQEIPGGARIAQYLDPQGALFAMHGDAPAA